MKAWIAALIMVSIFSVEAGASETPSVGIASWYSRTDPGVRRRTASGERFNDLHATCASWHYPFGTYLKVTNVRNGRSVVVRVNDRGPKKSLNRVIDLTKGSFRLIADPKHGLAKVRVSPADPK